MLMMTNPCIVIFDAIHELQMCKVVTFIRDSANVSNPPLALPGPSESLTAGDQVKFQKVSALDEIGMIVQVSDILIKDELSKASESSRLPKSWTFQKVNFMLKVAGVPDIRLFSRFLEDLDQRTL